MANKIQVKRGLKANIPTLSAGEIGYTTDTRETFVGTGSGNVNMGGSHWYTGTAMSGTSTTTGYYSYSACPEVKLGDIYLNTTYGYVYQCTTAGSGTTAKWTYRMTIKGTNATTTSSGNSSTAGLLKLSDSTSSTSNVNSGIAATPAAVKAAYDLANSKISLSELFDGTSYANMAELALDVSDMWGYNIDGGFQFNYCVANGPDDLTYSGKDFYITNGTWYYKNYEIATLNDIPSSSTFMEKSGGTFTGVVTHNSNIGIGSGYYIYPTSYTSNKSLYITGSTTYFGSVGTTSSTGNAVATTNYFGFRNYNSSTSYSQTNYFGYNYNSSYISGTNYFGYNVSNNYIGRNCTGTYVGSTNTYIGYNGSATSTNTYIRGTNIYVTGNNRRVVGTSVNYQMTIHVSSSQPTMSVGDIWLKIPA